MVLITLDIDDEILDAARRLSVEAQIPLGVAVSELARRGLRPRVVDDGFPMFDVAADAPLMTPAMVAEARDE